MEKLIQEWTAACADYAVQIEAFESGRSRTVSSGVDTTPETLQRLRACLENLQSLIATHRPA